MNFNRLPMKSRSSNRRHRITVERLTRVQDSDGYLVTEKETLGPYWASVNPVSEKQRTEYQGIGTECTHIVRCDAKLDILETDQIIFKNRVFEILTAINIHEIERDAVITTKEIRPKQGLDIPEATP